MSVANTIFSAAEGLVRPPGGSITLSSGVSEGGSPASFGPVAHTDTDISRGAAGPVPNTALAALPAAPAVGTHPTTAAYAATHAAITWAAPPGAVAPTYRDALTPATLPTSALPTAPALVQQAPLTPERHAGLTAYTKPAIAIGARPGLIDPSLAAFDVTPLAPLQLTLPTVDAGALDLDALADPAALTYTDDTALIARIRQALTGSDVLTAAEQELLYGELTLEQAREDLRAVRKVMTEAAARGFSMPFGAAQTLVADIAYASRKAKQGAALKVRDETFERAKALLLDAFAKAVAIETKHFALHLSYCGKLVDTLKYNVRMQAELFNGVVRLYNDKVALIRTVVAAYRDYVAALDAQDKAIVGQLRVQMARATAYRADVEMFSAQAGTLKTFAEVEALGVEAQVQTLQEYEAYLVGVRANVDVVKRNIEAFRVAVGTMKDVSDVESAKFSAYADQVGAFASVEDVYSANVGAYAGFWKAENARTGAFSAYIDDSVRALSAEARTFSEYAQAQRSYVSALGAKVDAELDNVRTWAGAQRSRGQWLSAHNRAQAEVNAAANAQSLANSSIGMLNSALDAQATAENDRIRASLLAAEATSEAGLEQAKLAVRSVSVSIRGEASGSENDSTGTSTSNGAKTSFSTQHITDH